MQVHEEWYDHPGNEALQPELTSDFQAAVAWPAMNSLCRIDFVEDAKPGDAFTMELARDGYYYKIELGFIDEDELEVWGVDEDEEDADDEDADGPFIFADLTVSRRRHDLQDQLLKVFQMDRTAQAQGSSLQSRPEPDEASLVKVETAESDEEPDRPYLEAWETRRYHFSPVREHGICVDISYDLVDGKAAVWSTESPVDWNNRQQIMHEAEVEEAFGESLTTTDLVLIRKGFAALGVNPVFLEWYPPPEMTHD